MSQRDGFLNRSSSGASLIATNSNTTKKTPSAATNETAAAAAAMATIVGTILAELNESLNTNASPTSFLNSSNSNVPITTKSLLKELSCSNRNSLDSTMAAKKEGEETIISLALKSGATFKLIPPPPSSSSSASASSAPTIRSIQDTFDGSQLSCPLNTSLGWLCGGKGSTTITAAASAAASAAAPPHPKVELKDKSCWLVGGGGGTHVGADQGKQSSPTSSSQRLSLDSGLTITPTEVVCGANKITAAISTTSSSTSTLTGVFGKHEIQLSSPTSSSSRFLISKASFLTITPSLSSPSAKSIAFHNGPDRTVSISSSPSSASSSLVECKIITNTTGGGGGPASSNSSAPTATAVTLAGKWVEYCGGGKREGKTNSSSKRGSGGSVLHGRSEGMIEFGGSSSSPAPSSLEAVGIWEWGRLASLTLTPRGGGGSDDNSHNAAVCIDFSQTSGATLRFDVGGVEFVTPSTALSSSSSSSQQPTPPPLLLLPPNFSANLRSKLQHFAGVAMAVVLAQQCLGGDFVNRCVRQLSRGLESAVATGIAGWIHSVLEASLKECDQRESDGKRTAEQLAALETEAAALRKTVAGIRKEILTTSSESKSLLKEVGGGSGSSDSNTTPPTANNTSKQHEEAMQSLSAELESLTAAFKTIGGHHASLKTELAELTRRYNEMQAALRASAGAAAATSSSKTSSSKGHSTADDHDALTKKLQDVEKKLAQQQSLLETAQRSVDEVRKEAAEEGEGASSNTVMTDRIAELKAKLADVRSRASRCGGGGGATTETSAAADNTSPPPAANPHCALRTKYAQSSIAQLQKSIEALTLRLDDVSAELEEMGEAEDAADDGQNDTEEEEQNMTEKVSTAANRVESLKKSHTDLLREQQAALDRHTKSIQNLKERTDDVNSRYGAVHTTSGMASAVTTDPNADAHASVRHLTAEVGKMDSSITALSKKLQAAQKTLRRLKEEEEGTGDNPSSSQLPATVEDLKQQMEQLKKSNLETEQDNDSLRSRIDQLVAKQREREQALLKEKNNRSTASTTAMSSSSASSSAMGDDRMDKLQREVERRDAIIAQLRSESQRTKQLEAKLLATKAQVGVQKQHIAQDAQLAAARSVAQGRNDDALWFAKTAGGRRSNAAARGL